MPRVLVVDDEEDVRAALKRRLEREGYQVETASGVADAGSQIVEQNPPFDVVITDMSMDEGDSGLRVLQEAMANDLFTEVIVLTAYGNVANAVESMRRGAFDYVEKNVPGVDVFELLLLKVAQAMERRHTSVTALRRLEQFSARANPPRPQ